MALVCRVRRSGHIGELFANSFRSHPVLESVVYHCCNAGLSGSFPVIFWEGEPISLSDALSTL